MSGSKSSGATVSDTNWMQPSERGFWVVLPLSAGGWGVLLSPVEDRFPSGEALLDLTSHAELPAAGMNQRKGPSLGVHAHASYQSGRNWHHAQAKITF